MTSATLTGAKITFFANVDWSFLSHRTEIARACVAAGADVSLMAGDTGRIAEVEEFGVEPVPLSMSRTGIGPLNEFRALSEVTSALHRLKPDVQHNVSIKPVLYGTTAAMTRRPKVLVNAVSGAGSLFDIEGRALRTAIDGACRVLRPVMRSDRVSWIFQNEADLELYQQHGLVGDGGWSLTMGSGVDLERFRPTPLPKEPVVLFASRLIWSKGIGTFVDAAELVRKQHPDVRFVIAGDPEDDNAGSIGREVLDDWIRSGHVEWAGVVEDMPALYREASIFCLPSWYREGVPRVLLEAAAAGRPAIAGDIPGARRAIDDGRTGLLITDPRDPEQLADAINGLLDHPDELTAMGSAAAERAQSEFGVEHVVSETLGLYERRLAAA